VGRSQKTKRGIEVMARDGDALVRLASANSNAERLEDWTGQPK
jgi:hypothetical protein